MARRIESRVGIPGVRVVEGDTGARELMRGVKLVGGQLAETAFKGLATVREQQGIAAARQAELTRDAGGNLVSPGRSADVAFPSIYSTAYDDALQKRFLNEMGIDAAEKFSEYHNRFQLDPEGFRIAADAYTEELLSGVGDEVYEQARGFLHMRASQHFTDIANARAQRDFEDGRAITIDVLERLLSDTVANASNPDVDDEARLAQHAELEAHMEAELQFASADDINQLTGAQANTIRDQFMRVTALGEIRRGALGVFAQAQEVKDVEVLIREATVSATENIPADLVALMGGPDAARDMVEQTISMAGYERAVALAGRDMRESWRFDELARMVQTKQSMALSSGNYEEFTSALALLDLSPFRDVSKRGSVIQMQASGERLTHEMFQSNVELQMLRTMATQLAEQDPRQMEALAIQAGVPWNSESGQAQFPNETYQSPGRMQDAVAKLRAMLRLVEDNSSKLTATQQEAQHHNELTLALLAGIADRRGVDLKDLAERAGKGNSAATVELQNVYAELKTAVKPHKWTKGHREAMDELHILPMVAMAVGADPATLGHLTHHAFEVAMQKDQGAAAQAINYYERNQGLSESAMRFLHATGSQLAQGTEQIPNQDLGAAMMLYDVLRQNPMARDNADLPESVMAGFNRLFQSGFRGHFGQDQFQLSGGAAVAAQQTYVGQSETTEAERLRALGLDPKDYGTTLVSETISTHLHNNWFRREMGYPDFLAGQVQRYVERTVAQTGNNVEQTVKALKKTNFYELGYGVTSMVAAGWQREDKPYLVQSAPGNVFIDAAARRDSLRYEEVAKEILAEDFSHISPDLLKGRLMLTGIEEQQAAYHDPNGVVSDTLYTAMAFVIDGRGMEHMLTDKNGNPAYVNVNDLMKRAWKVSEDRKLERLRQQREAMRWGLTRSGWTGE